MLLLQLLLMQAVSFGHLSHNLLLLVRGQRSQVALEGLLTLLRGDQLLDMHLLPLLQLGRRQSWWRRAHSWRRWGLLLRRRSRSALLLFQHLHQLTLRHLHRA